MNLSRATAVIVLALLAPLEWAAAQDRRADPLITDRPDFTESAATVAPGKVQLESGYTFTREGGVKTHALGEVLLRIGVLGNAELRLGLNSYMFTQSPAGDDDGLEDAFLGAKFKLLEGPSQFDLVRPSVALLLGTTLPTGADGFGEDEAQPEAKLALAWSLSEVLSLGSNLNYAYARTDGDGFNQFSGSFTIGVAISDRLGGYAEYYGFAPATFDGSETSFLNGGLTLLLAEDLQLDGRAGIGLDGPDPNYFAGIGFAWRR